MAGTADWITAIWRPHIATWSARTRLSPSGRRTRTERGSSRVCHRRLRSRSAVVQVGSADMSLPHAAEIGDITRFATAARLCSWAGLTPRHRESGTKVSRGHITKQGSPLVRWALVEAIQHVAAGHRCVSARRTSSAAAATRHVTLPRSPQRASCSPGSSTRCATARSAPWPPPRGRRREQARTQAARDRWFYWPRHRGAAAWSD